jgi:bifunctional non-homologous end joining protein LigD
MTVLIEARELSPGWSDPVAQDQANLPHDNIGGIEPTAQSSMQPTGQPTGQPSGQAPDHILSAPRDPVGRPVEETDPGLPQATPPQWPVIEPQRAKRAESVPEGASWVHEVELVGRRILAHVRDGEVRLYSGGRDLSSRPGFRADWTARLPSLARELAAPVLVDSVLDGILCALDCEGRSCGERLEQALAEGRESELVFFAFDLLFANGEDLRASPLIERKLALRDLLEQLVEQLADRSGEPRVRACEYVLGAGAKVFNRACELGLEGVISKRVDSIYEGRTSDAWLEVKCAQRLNLVVGGFTAPHGSRRHLGALLVGSYDAEGRLIYRGKVGSGFCEDSLAQLRPQLEQLQQELPAFFDPPVGSQARGVSWIAPVLGVEVEYGELTDKGKLRHARFKGLRPCTNAGTASLLDPDSNDAPREDQPATSFAMVSLTNADQLLFPAIGSSKRDLADYVQQATEKMLPHVCGRVLSLVRCPNGVSGEHRRDLPADCLREGDAKLPEGVTVHRSSDGAGTEVHSLSIVDALGLLELVQMNVVEVHARGARIDKGDFPDRLLFDLDPAEGVDFARAIEAAIELRHRLAEFGIESFVKTSGGSGLHVVAPVQRRRAYAPVARFCRFLVERMIAAAPDRYASLADKERRGKVVINYARNARQATMVAPYSVRARPDALVSTPLSWEELTGHGCSATPRPEEFTLGNVATRLARLDRNPWAEFFELRQWITKASFRKIGINPDLRAAQPLSAHP